jgi:hypothetical protein
MISVSLICDQLSRGVTVMSLTDSFSAAPASSSGESRRRLLTLLGAGGAASLAALLSSDEARAGHDGTNVFHLGEDNVNPPGTSTALSGSGPTTLGGLAALELFGGLNVGGGSFMTNAGRALRIINSDPNSHDSALTVSTASSESGTVDVYGPGPGATLSGISGSEGDGPGAPSGSGIGVAGTSGTGVGVQASSPDGLALLVDGTSAFSTVGSAVIAAGRNAVYVANKAVTPNSHISVTLVSDPGPRQVRWVRRRPGQGFDLHLTPASPSERPETSLTYMIVEPTP